MSIEAELGLPARPQNAVRLLGWNVNGIRSCLKSGWFAKVAQLKVDAICLQEVRALPDQVSLDEFGYHVSWHPAEKKGYSGTAIMSRTEPMNLRRGFGGDEFDPEGRVLTAEFKDYFLVSSYSPNSQRELTRLTHRQKWDQAFATYLLELQKKKPVICTGDFNVAHKEIDLANPAQNRRNAGFTDEERAGFSRLVDSGFIDTFREFETGPGHYSWWTHRHNARERNIGWRLDYFIISGTLRPRLQNAFIVSKALGSDHAPVGIDLILKG